MTDITPTPQGQASSLKKKPAKKLIIIPLLFGATLLALLFLPCPIEGNWSTTTIDCICESHNFLRFEHGKVLYISELHPPPDWLGTYERIGLGKYNVTMFLGSGSGEVHPKPVFLARSGPLRVTWRDFAFWKTSRILRDPAQQWIKDVGTWNIVVRHVDGAPRYYFAGREVDLQKAERIFTRISKDEKAKKQPFAVYAETADIPPALRDMFAKIGIEYEQRQASLLQRAN